MSTASVTISGELADAMDTIGSFMSAGKTAHLGTESSDRFVAAYRAWRQERIAARYHALLGMSTESLCAFPNALKPRAMPYSGLELIWSILAREYGQPAVDSFLATIP